MVSIAHLSDPHLDGSAHALDRLRQIADHLRNLEVCPDIIIVSGDLTQSNPSLPASDRTAAALEGLDSLLETLDIGIPVVCCPGNADDRTAFAQRFGKAPPGTSFIGTEPIHQVHRVGTLTILLFDVTVPGSVHGHMTDLICSWATGQLDRLAGDERAVLVMHHPPTPLYRTAVDDLFLRGSEALKSVVRHERVIATLCGHTHAALATTFAGKPLVIAPGIRSAGLLPQEIAGPGSPLTTENVPPAYAIHVIVDGCLSSHFRTLVPSRR